MEKVDKTKLMSQLTVEEFLRVMKNIRQEKQYEYGLNGLARILGCGRTKAAEIKKSGILDGAIFQQGKLIVIDKSKAIELLHKSSPAKQNQ